MFPGVGALREVALDDKYTLERGAVFLSGTQALVRLPLEQRRRDARAGLNTAGFVSGYRGSPLGGYDLALWQARKFLEGEHVRFEPGLNEELAATAV
jgi:indolepyruvate ferredoxin oxidoreductase